jgi:toxin ParE1/3/4
MPLLFRTTQADADIIDAYLYIAAENRRAADKWFMRLEATLVMLSEYPRAGRRRPYIMRKLRSFPHKNYLIYYVPHGDGIAVLRVLHGARRLGRHFFRSLSF